MVGKFKTTVQMIAIILLILIDTESVVYGLGMFLLYVAAVLTLWSMLLYLRAAWPSLTSTDLPENGTEAPGIEKTPHKG
jgi:CDP-diacylglycerol--glycerol-3-phosphate 3-phosphatidyltransferase/cardiolipin synthase